MTINISYIEVGILLLCFYAFLCSFMLISPSIAISLSHVDTRTFEKHQYRKSLKLIENTGKHSEGSTGLKNGVATALNFTFESSNWNSAPSGQSPCLRSWISNCEEPWTTRGLIELCLFTISAHHSGNISAGDHQQWERICLQLWSAACD